MAAGDDVMDFDFNLLNDDDDDDDFDGLGGGGVGNIVNELRTAWMNERAAPELLQYAHQMVDEVKEQVRIQTQVLGREVRTPQEQFVQNLYRQDIDRVKFMLSSYLRCRIRKIETYVLYILSSDDLTARLSETEYDYAVGYADLMEKHFMLSFLNNIPAMFRSLITAEERMVPMPNLDAHVVIQVNDDIGPFAISADDEVELSRNDILFASYRPFRELLQTNRVSLR